jgi:hypothetical protein
MQTLELLIGKADGTYTYRSDFHVRNLQFPAINHANMAIVRIP